MSYPDNDNEPLTFQPLSAITEKVLMKTPKQNDERSNDCEAEQRSESGKKPDREYVEQRVRDIAAFERRARGNG